MLQRALDTEERFWPENSRLNWNLFGDKNTRYFHKVAHYCGVIKHIYILKHDDQLLIALVDIESHTLTNNIYEPNSLVASVIPSIVTKEDNSILIAFPSFDEVKNVVFNMNGINALDLDGFEGHFYNTFWDNIGPFVFDYVLQIFNWVS